MIEPASPQALRRAGERIRAGEVVAFPTETVYGLGADARSDAAVARIFEVKRRPSFNPLIVHVADAEAAFRLGTFDATARALAERFWPGPLSVVVPRTAGCPVSLLASAGLDTVAVRVPAHPAARALLAAAACPVAAPSANMSGGISPTLASHVAAALGDGVPVVDDGPCAVGLESTVVDCSGPQAAILRPGGVAAGAIAAVAGPLAMPAADGGGPMRSPGMMERHYAPAARLRLDAASVTAGEALLSFGRHGIRGAAAERNLSARSDLREAAANLFAMLHELDRPEHRAIAAMPVPDSGLGQAINDRLRRAAAPEALPAPP